jgi:hypothetical protein
LAEKPPPTRPVASGPPDPHDPVVIDAAALSPTRRRVDDCARVALGARRQGRDVILDDACAELRDHIAFLGLPTVLRCREASGRDASGG